MSVIAPDWPIFFKNILRIGNLKSNIAVVTLWTERDVVEKNLPSASYAAIGNLYAAAGINHMIRNIFANPMIRYLIIWGADMSQSGHALVKLMQDGIDENRQIIGARGELEREIPKRAVETFRKSVHVIDMRGRPLAHVVRQMQSLKKLPPFAKTYQTFPPAKPVVSSWPSESIGFRVEANSVAQTWLRILNLIQRYGRTEKTRYASNNKLKEILNLTAVIAKENPTEEYLPHYLPFSRRELDAYYPEMMTKRKIPGSAYNYGDRMRNQEVSVGGAGKDSQKEKTQEVRKKTVDQITQIIQLLKRRPFSKKGFAVLYRCDDWLRVDTSDTPCLTQLHARITENKLFLTAYFRSQDMFHGWPRNAFALRRVQKEIADGVNLPLGPLTIITMSAHMYADDWKTTENILADSFLAELKYPPRYPHFVPDRRGNWLIDVEYDEPYTPPSFYVAPVHTHAIRVEQKTQQPNGKILAKLYPDERMQSPLLTLQGRTAKEIFWQIVDWEIMSLPGHIFSIGEELTKAEIALRLGLEFKMDAPLDMKKRIKKRTKKTTG